MSLIGLEEVISVNREDLEKCKIRGIDLDYLVDPRVDHAGAMRALEALLAGPMVRWRTVRNSMTQSQWDYWEAIEESNRETRALNAAAREVREKFKSTVLKFFKEAEQRMLEERKKDKKK